MHAITLISKMAPKAINYDAVGGGSSLDVIDWRDAAHSLVGLSTDAGNWALYRFAGQEEKRHRIVRSLAMNITLFIKLRRYKIKQETLDGIINAAIFEFELPLCGVCDGSGIKINAEREFRDCSPCRGRGRKSLSMRKRATIIGIDHTSYTNNHDEVAKALMSIIATWEQQIIKNVNKKAEDVA